MRRIIILLLALVGAAVIVAGGLYFLKDDSLIAFPEPEAIIVIDIDTYGYELPESKDQGSLNTTMKIKVNGVEKKTLGKIKVQGSSTAKWPKKNWTLEFFSDRNREKSVDIKIGDSIASDHWIAKAEWIDPALLRNGLSYRLWASIVDSRTESPKYEVERALEANKENGTGQKFAGAQGFPVTHPAQVIINGDHYGLAMLTLGHDPRNFNIQKDKLNHLYMEFDARGGYTSTKTWEKFTIEGIGEWLDGYHPKNDDMTSEQKLAIGALGDFINSPLDEFEKDFDKFLDRENMIDMLLFLEMIYDYDAIAQDLEIFTHNLEKWYMLPWDKDTTFGMDWNMKGILKNSESKLLINYKKEDPEQIPWYKTYHCFRDQIEARYSHLRNAGVFTVENLANLIDDIVGKIPQEVWDAEAKKWEAHERPPIDEVGKNQILSWFEDRLEVLDKQFNYQ